MSVWFKCEIMTSFCLSFVNNVVEAYRALLCIISALMMMLLLLFHKTVLVTFVDGISEWGNWCHCSGVWGQPSTSRYVPSETHGSPVSAGWRKSISSGNRPNFSWYVQVKLRERSGKRQMYCKCSVIFIQVFLPYLSWGCVISFDILSIFFIVRHDFFSAYMFSTLFRLEKLS